MNGEVEQKELIYSFIKEEEEKEREGGEWEGMGEGRESGNGGEEGNGGSNESVS